MFITDSQIHIWAADTPERPWPDRPGRPQGQDSLTAEAVIAQMDEAGGDRAVLVPPSWEGDRNDVVLRAAEQYPTRFGVMGRVILEEPAPDVVRDWLSTPGML